MGPIAKSESGPMFFPETQTTLKFLKPLSRSVGTWKCAVTFDGENNPLSYRKCNSVSTKGFGPLMYWGTIGQDAVKEKL